MPKLDAQVPTLVACSAAAAGGRIIRIVARAQGDVKCPRDSDGWLDTPAGSQTACLRDRVGPHPGDAGKGGGVLRVGDCTLIEDGDVQERACYDTHGPGKIRSFTKTKKACERRIWSYAFKRNGSYLCVGPGEDATKVRPAYKRGSCLTAPRPRSAKSIFGGIETAIVGGLEETSCKGKEAWGKVVGHVSIEFERKRPADYSLYRGAGQCSRLQAGGVGPRGKAPKGLSVP
ncbi:hypothetical protein OHA25_23245 [Nonomuraea sp. NBC_00507]|uniref:hypothetical protein n=1 Tax=Nonomuraea sp. NBC_00507 TaxID=2976002 RepID=UPI002E16E8C3